MRVSTMMCRWVLAWWTHAACALPCRLGSLIPGSACEQVNCAHVLKFTSACECFQAFDGREQAHVHESLLALNTGLLQNVSSICPQVAASLLLHLLLCVSAYKRAPATMQRTPLHVTPNKLPPSSSMQHVAATHRGGRLPAGDDSAHVPHHLQRHPLPPSPPPAPPRAPCRPACLLQLRRPPSARPAAAAAGAAADHRCGRSGGGRGTEAGWQCSWAGDEWHQRTRAAAWQCARALWAGTWSLRAPWPWCQQRGADGHNAKVRVAYAGRYHCGANS